MIVGIAGPTCSGKSSIAQRIITALPSDVVVIAQDDFYKADGFAKVGPYDNWDEPTAIDFDRFVQRVTEVRLDRPQALILLEGNMLYFEPRIVSLCDVKFVLDLDRDTCLTRRLTRDEWLRENSSYFELCIWPGHERLKAHVSSLANTTLLDGAQSLAALTAHVLNTLR